MLLAYLLFAAVDTSTKWLLAAGLPVLQLAFFRYAVHFAITVVDVGLNGGQGLNFTRRQALLLTLRAFLLVTATLVNFLALKYLPLSVTAAIMFSAPIIVGLLAGPLLGERIGGRRWAAIIFGFCGVLVVIRPFEEGFSWAALMMLYPATCLALYSILTRKLTAEVTRGAMQFILGLIGTLALAPFMPVVWTLPVSWFDALLMPCLGVFAWAGHQYLVRAHVMAPSSVLMPFSYSYLIYLTLAGAVFFSEVPDQATILGAAMIVASGLFLWAIKRHV